jgi:anaerobic selenocysteine-containing dehydrogenase
MLLQDSARVERWVEANAVRGGELTLIGRRHLRSNNSWMHNCASLVKGPDRATALVHPADAARLGVVAGRPVRLRTRVGAVTAIAQISDEMMPGVVSVPHGFGHAAVADTLRIAGATKGPNANAITDDAQVDPLSGTAVLNGVPVVVEPVLGDEADAGRDPPPSP